MTDDLDLLIAVHQVVDAVLGHARPHGPLPAIGTPTWYAAPAAVQIGTLLVLAEAWLVHDPELAIAERLKAASIDLSDAHDWSAASRRPSHAELQRRRGEAA